MTDDSPDRATKEAQADSGAQGSTRRDLDRSLVMGIAWTGSLRWASQIISWVGTVLVARLLDPQDFGLLGMAMVYTGLVQLVNDFGIGSAIVQRKELRASQVSGLGAVSLVIGGGLFLLSAGLSGPVAAFFQDTRVQWIVLVLSVNFLLTSVGSISRSLLARDLRFQALAWIDGLRTVFTSVVTLVLAWMGFRYWSLVIGSVFSTFFAAVVAFWLRPFRPRWPRPFSDITSELAFGWNLVVSRIAWYGYSNADFAVVGRVLGTAALGAYNIGWTMASLPVEKISVMVMKVTPSVFARVQDDLPALRRYVNRLTEGLSVVTLPAAIGMALVARDFVTVVLGDKWLPAVVPLQILSVFVTYRSVTTLYADILEATDHTRLNMMFSVLGLIVLPVCFVVGTRWGTTGVAAAWAVGYPLITLSFHLSTTFRIIELRPSEYFASMWPAASSTAVMAVFVLAVQSAMGTALPGAARLTVSVLVGALAYAGALWVMHRRRVVASLEFVRSMRKKKKKST